MVRDNSNRKIDRYWREEVACKLGILNSSELAVLKELIRRGRQRGFCWPGCKLLARDTANSERTVRRALKVLEQLKLIRRIRQKRSDGSQGVHYYAITLPVFVQRSGQLSHNRADTESAQNKNLEYINNGSGDCFVDLEIELLKFFHGQIVFRTNPELFSVYEITNWIYGQPFDKWDHIKARIMNAASKLRDQLNRDSKNLESWNSLLEFLQPAPKAARSEPGSYEFDYSNLDHWADKLVGYLGEKELNTRSLVSSLASLSSEQRDGAIILRFQSTYSLDQVAQNCPGALKNMARDIGRPIRLFEGSQERRVFYPRN
jgi:DNA-binding transcriptional ArsR family regulator